MFIPENHIKAPIDAQALQEAQSTATPKKSSRSGLNSKCALVDAYYRSLPAGVARYERTHLHGGKTITYQLHNGESFKVTCSSGLQNVGQAAGMGKLTVESHLAGEPVTIPFAKISTKNVAGGFSLRTRFAINKTDVNLPKP